MDLVLWAFDGVTRHDGGGWDVALAERLTDAGATVRTADPYTTDPTRLAADGHVLSGGATVPGTTAGSRRALGHVARLVASARHTGMPVVGVCLGAQMLAVTIGGPKMSGPAPAGLELGIVDVEEPDGTVWTTATFHSHEISPRFAQVDGVDVAASNGHTAVQAFTYRSISAVQFHPELDREQLTEAAEVNVSWLTAGPAGSIARIRQGRQRPPATMSRWLLRPLGLT